MTTTEYRITPDPGTDLVFRVDRSEPDMVEDPNDPLSLLPVQPSLIELVVVSWMTKGVKHSVVITHPRDMRAGS